MIEHEVTDDIKELLRAVIEGEVVAISPFNIMLSKSELLDAIDKVVDKTITELLEIFRVAMKQSIDKEYEQLKKIIEPHLKEVDSDEINRFVNNMLVVYTLQTKRASFMKLVEIFIRLLLDKVLSGDDDFVLMVHLGSKGAENVLKEINKIIGGEDRMFG